VACVARVLRGEAAVVRLAGPRACGGGFIGLPRGPRRAGLGHCVREGRAAARLAVEPKSGSRSGMTPTGGACLAAREKRGVRGHRVGYWAGEGGRKQVGPARARGKRRKNRKGRLGCALREEKERGEKERESGPSQKRKRGRKRNSFECI
jgi:hypothetical protein